MAQTAHEAISSTVGMSEGAALAGLQSEMVRPQAPQMK
jgi:hypothetical protein